MEDATRAELTQFIEDNHEWLLGYAKRVCRGRYSLDAEELLHDFIIRLYNSQITIDLTLHQNQIKRYVFRTLESCLHHWFTNRQEAFEDGRRVMTWNGWLKDLKKNNPELHKKFAANRSPPQVISTEASRVALYEETCTPNVHTPSVLEAYIEEYEQQSREEQLARAIHQLSPRLRRLLEMRLEGLNNEEIMSRMHQQGSPVTLASLRADFRSLYRLLKIQLRAVA